MGFSLIKTTRLNFVIRIKLKNIHLYSNMVSVLFMDGGSANYLFQANVVPEGHSGKQDRSFLQL